MQTAGFSQRQDVLYPAIAFVTGRPQRALAPLHPKAQGPLRPIVRWLNAVVGQKHPQRVHLPEPAAPQPAGIVLALIVLVDQLPPPGIPRPPLPARGWGCRHRTATLPLHQSPGATGGNLWVRTRRQTAGSTDEMGQARLAGLAPLLLHPIAITDQEPLPVVDGGGERFLGATRMDHREGHPLAGHHPEPLQRVETVPGRFIHRVNRGVPRVPRNHRIVRVDGVGHPVEDFLDGPQADGDLEHGGTKSLHHASALAVCPGQLPHQGTEAGPVATGLLSRDVRLAPATTRLTPALMQHPVRHLHRDRG